MFCRLLVNQGPLFKLPFNKPPPADPRLQAIHHGHKSYPRRRRRSPTHCSSGVATWDALPRHGSGHSPCCRSQGRSHTPADSSRRRIHPRCSEAPAIAHPKATRSRRENSAVSSRHRRRSPAIASRRRRIAPTIARQCRCCDSRLRREALAAELTPFPPCAEPRP